MNSRRFMTPSRLWARCAPPSPGPELYAATYMVAPALAAKAPDRGRGASPRQPGFTTLLTTFPIVGKCAVSAVLLAAVTPSFAGEAAPARAAVASNIVLTAAQRQKLHVETIKPSSFRRTIETTGTVGFDSDQATTVLAPVGGPVSRLLRSEERRVGEEW